MEAKAGPYNLKCGCFIAAHSVTFCHLHAAASDMLAVLRKIEWAGEDRGVAVCPECDGNAAHFKGCELWAAITKADGGE